VLLVIVGVFVYDTIVYAATYTFTQSSWSGGVDAVSVAAHPTNVTNWTKYNSQTGLTVGATVSLTPTSYAFTDDGATSTSPTTAAYGGGFSNGTNSNTTVSGSDASASIALTPTLTPFNEWGSSLSAVPGAVGAGAAMIRNSTDNDIYVLRSSNSTGFYKYSISGNSWTTLTVVPGAVGSGAAMVRNGADDDIYVLTGNGTGFYKYSISGNSWTTLTVVPGAVGSGGTMIRNGADNDIYVLRGNLTGNFYKYSISGNSWTTLTGIPGAAAVGSGGTMIRNGTDNDIYVLHGDVSTNFYKYSISGNSWTALTAVPADVYAGSVMIRNSDGNDIYVLPGNSTTGFYKFIIQRNIYPSTGTFTSAVIDFGGSASLSTIAYGAGTTLPTGTGITFDMRAGNTATPDGSWSGWTTGIASGGSISAFSGNRYVQYRTNLSTTDTTVTPTLDQIVINYTSYGTSGNLISSAYDAGNATNIISKLTWVASATSSTEIIKFQARSSSDGVTWSAWCGYSDCSGSSYFTDGIGGNGVAIASNHSLRTGGDDRYFQYQAFLVSGGGGTPALTSVSVQYVVNAPPDFDATYGTNGVVVSQITDSANSSFGKVSISYSVRDTDTSTGTTNPSYITPSFEYSTNSGSSWSAIPSGDLQASDTTNKFVGEVTYATYTATWTASSTIPNIYNATVKIRVTANDNEAANNTGTAVSAVMTLDTLPPVAFATLDASTGASTGTITLTVTDNSQSKYRLCNDAAFPTADAQGNSCAWGALGANIASSTLSWIPLRDVSDNEPVYLAAEDALGNTTTRTIVAPATPGNFDLKDISNTSIDVYKEFLSWSVFTATSSSSFASYKLYHSTDGTTYTLLTTIADSAVNYYIDTIATATTSTHYYKAVTITSQGNTSAYTAVLSDIPNGQGGTDTTAPTISPASIIVPSANLKNTSALVTFTTDELAKGTVQYKKSTDVSWTTVNSASYVLAHSIYIQGLTPNTLYNTQVKAEDVAGNVSAYVSGPDLTTSGGPIISDVSEMSLTDNSVTITWNTSSSSDSYVYYSTNQDLSGSTTNGNATLVACIDAVCQHKVNLSSLTAATTYYYSVKSTDGTGNASIDTNTGSYYTFHTTLDVTPPVITGIDTPVMSASAAVIVWQTDKPATSQITWGTATGALTRTTILDTTKSIYHIVTLSGATNDTTNTSQALTASTPYYYQVFSTDAAGNSASSTEQTFTTTKDGQVVIVSGGGSYIAPTQNTTPPKIISVGTDGAGAFNAGVNIVTDKDTIALISYGESTNYGSIEGTETYSSSKIVTLKKLQQGTTYHYRVKVLDQFGNFAISDDKTFSTIFVSELLDDRAFLDKASDVQDKLEQLIESALPSLAPPFLTVPVVSSTTENSATVTWRTNIKTRGFLRYATDVEYFANKNDYKTEVSAGPATETNHSVDITNLTPNTLYHVQARSYIFPQVVGMSHDITFSTKAAAIVANIVAVKNDGFTVVWQTDEPTNSIVSYRNLKTGESGVITDESKKTYHNVQIQNLPSGISYAVSVSGVNKNGNTIGSAESARVTTSIDLTPPIISNFKVDNAFIPGRADRIQTVVGWRTDKPANSTVYYQEGTGNTNVSTTATTTELKNRVESLDTYTTTHIMILASLKPGTVYRLKIVSVDQSGNTKVFGPTSIITPNQTQSVLDIIVKNFEDTFKFLGAGQ